MRERGLKKRGSFLVRGSFTQKCEGKGYKKRGGFLARGSSTQKYEGKGYKKRVVSW